MGASCLRTAVCRHRARFLSAQCVRPGELEQLLSCSIGFLNRLRGWTMAMDDFSSYVGYLEAVIAEVTTGSSSADKRRNIDAILDDKSAQELRRLVPPEVLRASGAFFTGSELSQSALQFFGETLGDESVILDPACGAGDLLIACATKLRVETDLASTLQSWNGRITGRDIHHEFVRAAKARLVLTAIRAGEFWSDWTAARMEGAFYQIGRGCGLKDHNAIAAATHIVINPPYTLVDAPEDCAWGTGKTNAAALFLEACVLHATEGTRIVAILPDVLRSGSRYRKWRELIESRSRERRVQLYGQFDRWTDVDVFILELVVQHAAGGATGRRWMQPLSSETCVGDYFDVCVGSVVDYRDPRQGSKHPFITPRCLPSWRTVHYISKYRRFRGRLFSPPFVVVRRTSRRGDKHRAVGTVVNCAVPVAAENHLLVLLPKDGSVQRCVELLRVLKGPSTTAWLNQRIGCRHLTVSSLAEVPWWGDGR